MGYRHTKSQILEGALSAALSDGLSQLSFGRLARRLGISDRVIVYYFPSKEDLISDVLLGLGLQLQAALEPAFATRADDHVELLRAAWPILARNEVDPVFALYFEASGLAATGCEPYRTLVPRLVDGWIEWVGHFLTGTPGHRRTQAAAAVGVIDGLLLLRQLSGPDVADRAAIGLGILDRRPVGGGRKPVQRRRN